MDIMKIKTWLISAVILSVFSSCDDGDLIVTSFDFEDQSLSLCSGQSSLVFFKINNDAQESISLSIVATSEIFLQEEIADINLSATNFVSYRNFNGDVDASYFCSSVPPVSPQVNTEFLAENGIARLTNTLVLDDNDGLPEDIELILDNDGLPQDTDNDTIPDYFDFDDDGDNVPTILELFANNDDGDDNPLTPIKDTDEDGIPDYLDTDDDGDGVLTINESTDGDINPLNDVNDKSKGIPDFLNEEITITGFDIQEYIVHTANRNASVEVSLFNLVLANEDETIVQETLNLGALANVIDETIILTPIFQ